MKLNIRVDEDIAWLQIDGVDAIGSNNIDNLLERLKGVVELEEDNFTLKLLDEEKLTIILLFT